MTPECFGHLQQTMTFSVRNNEQKLGVHVMELFHLHPLIHTHNVSLICVFPLLLTCALVWLCLLTSKLTAKDALLFYKHALTLLTSSSGPTPKGLRAKTSLTICWY